MSRCFSILAIELSIGDLLVLKFHRDDFWCSHHLVFEQIVNAFVFRIVGFGVVPFDQNLTSLSIPQNGQGGDELVWFGHDGFEERLIMPRHSFDGILIEKIGAIFNETDKPLAPLS